MREVFLGEYIRHRRLELGLTQEQLCEGICEPITISRLETGKQNPTKNTITALLQRLGLPDDRYVALLSKRETELDALQKELVSYNIQYQNALEPEKSRLQAQAYEKLRQLEALAEENDTVTKQLILRSRVLLGKEGGGPYSLDEQLELLMDAIRLTVPRFDLEEINRSLYSLDEVKVINQIAGVYTEKGQHRMAAEILGQLLKYIHKHYQNILQSGGLLPLVSHNYARVLHLCKRYEEAIEVAQLGRESCVKFGHYQVLAGLLHTAAICYHEIGQHEQSKELFYQAYYLYKATGSKRGAYLAQTDAKEYENIEFVY